MTQGWQAMHAEIDESVGVILCTVLAFTHGGTRMERIYSSHPVEYPVGGWKDVATEVSPDWIAVSRDSESTFHGERDELERIFADAELIRSLGCASIVNVPIRDAAGVHWGTANLLAGAHQYDEAAIATLEDIVHRHASRIPAPASTQGGTL